MPYAGTTQDELVHQDLPGTATIDYVYDRTDRNGLPAIQSPTKSGDGTVYVDHDPGGTPQVDQLAGEDDSDAEPRK